LKDIGADPWNATQLITELSEQDGIPVLAFRQGFVSMSGPA
jgi:phage terminase large subunit-like protein